MKKIFLILFLLVSINLFAQNDEDKWVDSVFNSLTLEQKIGQLMNVRANNPNQDFNENVDEFIEKYNIGGLMMARSRALCPNYRSIVPHFWSIVNRFCRKT